MANTLKRSLVLLGVLLALLSYFFHFKPSLQNFLDYAFFPDGIDLRSLRDAWAFTIQLLPGVQGQPIFLISLRVVFIAYWSFLLLTLVQTGLALRTLRSCSRRVRTWSIRLAIWGLILIVLFAVGTLFAGAVFSLVFLREPAFQVNFWDVLSKVIDPVVLRDTFLLVSSVLWLPSVGFVLILVFNCLTQPREDLPQRA